jgi:hypothetical protein
MMMLGRLPMRFPKTLKAADGVKRIACTMRRFTMRGLLSNFEL